MSAPTMSTSTDRFDRELFQRIDEVLLYHWDPSGLARDPLAREHYAGFVPDVFAAPARRCRRAAASAELLLLLETEFLGLAPRPSTRVAWPRSWSSGARCWERAPGASSLNAHAAPG